jgi:ABC-2 type transport system permease protein
MKNIVAFQTIVRKEVVRFMRIWLQTLLPSAITMTLYFIIFGTFIGSQIDNISGFSYMQFILPGLVMMAVITNSYSNVVSSFFGAKFGKSIEELLVAPVSNSTIILGYISGGVLRSMMVGVLVMLVGLFFVPLQVYNWFYLLLFLFLTSITFSLAGFLNSIFATKFDDVSIIPVFVLTPLTYLGGVFYSISVLPTFWQKLSMLNPILYMVNGFRFGFLGLSDVSVTVGVLILLGFIGILYSFSWYFLEKGIGLKT